MSGPIMTIGDRRVVVRRYSGQGLVNVGQDMFVRPCDLPSGVAIVRETQELRYRYPTLRTEPQWELASVELDPMSMVEAPPPPPTRWQRLWVWLNAPWFSGRARLPEARTVDRG